MTYDHRRLSELIQSCCEATGSTQKGAALEDLVEHMFTSVPSVELYDRDVKDESGSQEIDLVFSHIMSESRFPIPDVTIMVECKNEQALTTASQIREFASKLQSRCLTIGILVTSAGITGDSRASGHQAITDMLMAGTVIIVVLRDELGQLRGPDALAELLRRRMLELQTFRGYRSL